LITGGTEESTIPDRCVSPSNAAPSQAKPRTRRSRRRRPARTVPPRRPASHRHRPDRPAPTTDGDSAPPPSQALLAAAGLARLHRCRTGRLGPPVRRRHPHCSTARRKEPTPTSNGSAARNNRTAAASSPCCPGLAREPAPHTR
jgi:hypothetical protein